MLQRNPRSSIHFQSNLPGWMVVAGGLTLLAVIAALAFLALGLLFLVLPLLLIAPAIRYLMQAPKHKPAPRATNSDAATGIVIDGNFRVIDPGAGTEEFRQHLTPGQSR